VALALVNINNASLTELKTLTGIGDVKGQAIIDYRNNIGAFSVKEDIMNVSGIGTATFDSIKNNITVSGATTVIVDDVDNENEVDNSNQKVSSSSDGSNQKEVHQPVSGLTLTMPKIAYTGQLIDFAVDPQDGTNGRLVRYSWNFGDGHVSAEKNPSHQYVRPGTYVVVVESYFQKTVKLARRELTVLPLQLDIVLRAGGGVEVVNKSDEEIDLSGMTISGTGTFIFPKHSILLAGASMVIDSVSGPSVSLWDELGRTLAFNNTPPTTSMSVAAKARVSSTASSITPAVATATIPVVSEEVIEPSAIANTAAVADANLPPTVWPYLGLLAVISIGFVALFGTRWS
jgi:competence ComEA-like helix-hairpin-helix protein